MQRRVIKDKAAASIRLRQAAHRRVAKEKAEGKKAIAFAGSLVQNEPAFKRWLREQDEIIATYSTQDFRGY
jgi:hypothetical protein